MNSSCILTCTSSSALLTEEMSKKDQITFFEWAPPWQLFWNSFWMFLTYHLEIIYGYIFWHSIWHTFWVFPAFILAFFVAFILQRSGARGWRPVHTAICRSPLRSGSAHMCPLRSGARSDPRLPEKEEGRRKNETTRMIRDPHLVGKRNKME